MRAALAMMVVASLVFAGCGGDDGGGANATTTSQLIGPEGGTVALVGGGKVEIPPGAVTSRTEIKISKRELDDVAPLPFNLEAAGKPYAFEPHGFTFRQPIKISVPFENEPTEVRPVKLDDEADTTWTTVVDSEKDDATKELSFHTTSFSVILAARPRRASGVITLPDGAIATDGGDAGTGGLGGTGGAGTGGVGGSGGTGGGVDAGDAGDAGLDAATMVDASNALDAGIDATIMVDAGSDAAAMVDAGGDAMAMMMDAGTVPWPGMLEAYIKASNTGAFDAFGINVALSADGNTLAVGAYHEGSDATGVGGDQSNNNAIDSGAVYVFARTGGTWVQEAYVKASNAEASDTFGIALALSADGNTLAVGAWHEDSSATGVYGNEADNSVSNSGAVYVFDRNQGWSQVAYVKASNTETNDSFGVAVALSGDGLTLAVSSTAESGGVPGVNGDGSDNSVQYSGAVYVYRATTGWAHDAYIKASNPGMSDGFGRSIALDFDGNRLLVGAPFEDSNGTQTDNSQPDSGAVYVFDRDGNSWAQTDYLKGSNTEAGDNFGSAVSLSADGMTAAIGADMEDSPATGINGVQTNGSNASGAVYVLQHNGSSWGEQAYLKASNADADDQFGGALSISGDGNTLAVGADLEDGAGVRVNPDESSNTASNAGAAYVFTRVGPQWAQQAYVKASNTGAGDRFGGSVAISGDGTTLAVGANAEQSSGVGINGANNNSAVTSGAAYAYVRQ